MPVDWTGPAGTGTVTSTCAFDAAGRTMTIEQQAHLTRGVVEAKDYDQLIGLQQALTHPKARTVLLIADTPKAAAAAGIPFDKLCNTIARAALRDAQNANQRRRMTA